MVTPSAGSIVTVRFPFSDLSNAKLRPAVVLADAGRGDWILCQITSNSYSDSTAISLDEEDFITGSLHRISYARPGKIFTANESILASHIDILNDDAFRKIVNTVIHLLQANIPT